MAGADILIVGGGITGLTLAHYLGRQGVGARVRLVEAASRLGGWIRTEQIDAGAGAVHFETGPRSLNRIRGQRTLQLCDEVGLADAVRPASAASHQRFVVGRDRRLLAVPSTPWAMIRSDLTRRMPPYLFRDLVWPVPMSTDRDLTMDEFFRARLGPDAADMLASALAAGVYAGDSRRLSVCSCLPSLVGMVAEQGSLVRGLIRASMMKPKSSETSPNWESMQQRLGTAPMYSFDGGLSMLVSALERFVQADVSLHTDTKVDSLCPKTLSVTTSDGQRHRFSHVFWTGSTLSLAPVLSGDDDAVCALRAVLARVPYASIACVTLIWNRHVTMAHGFGVLIPSCVQGVPPVLGVTFDSQTFPTQSPTETTTMTVMMGGDRNPELSNAPDHELVELALRTARDLLGVYDDSDFVTVHKALDAIPQFYVGHGALVQEIVSNAARINPGLHLIGTATSGVAINDCIRASYQASLDLSDHVSQSSNVFKIQQ